MTQASTVINNTTFPIVRQSINNAMETIKTCHSGATPPTVTEANMLWADTGNYLLKMRNSSDTSWVIIGVLDKGGLIDTGTSSPDGSLTGLYAGQIFFDSGSNTLWTYDGSGTNWTQVGSNIFGGESSRSGTRSCVILGKVDGNGNPSYIGTGFGLKPTVLADASNPLVLTLSGGFDLASGKEVDYIKLYTENTAWDSDLHTNNTSSLFVERVGSNYVLGSTVQVPQVGTTYNSKVKWLLEFEGANGSTTITDSYNNPNWTVVGNAQIKTDQFKFGSSSVYFDGTGDYIETTDTGNGYLLGNYCDAWTYHFWFRADSLPALNTSRRLFHGYNGASDYPLAINLRNTSGAYYIQNYISSNNSSWDIANATLSSAITISANTWNHLAIVRESGYYRIYFNGVQVWSLASVLQAALFQSFRMALSRAGAEGFIGYMDAFEFVNNVCLFPAGTSFTPPTNPPVLDAEWYDINAMKYKVGGGSTWAEKTRLLLGTAKTDGSNVTSVNINGMERIKQRSEIRCIYGNGAGSSGTYIKRFLILARKSGSDIGYTDSAVNGASFTIKTSGIYAIYHTAARYTFSTGGVGAGISVNSTQLSTAILSINKQNVLATDYHGVGGVAMDSEHTASFTGYLEAGDVVRPHVAVSGLSHERDSFSITKIN